MARSFQFCILTFFALLLLSFPAGVSSQEAGEEGEPQAPSGGDIPIIDLTRPEEPQRKKVEEPKIKELKLP